MRTAKQFLEKLDEETCNMWTEDDDAIINGLQEYANEFACAFAEFMSENYVPILQHGELQYWQKNYQDKSKKYTTTELLEIFKKEQDGK